MSRILPEVKHICHVCGTQYIISNEGLDPFTDEGEALLETPVACPCCTALEKSRGEINEGAVKGLVMAFYDVDYYRETFGTAEQYLERYSLNVADVDSLMALVERIDYAAWETNLLTEPSSDPEVRKELAAVRKARAAATNGRLRAELQGIAAQVKATLDAERQRCLALYEQTCGAGKKPPMKVYRGER